MGAIRGARRCRRAKAVYAILDDISWDAIDKALVRAEWVSQALPQAEIAAYAGAQMFDICDIVNRSDVLVSDQFFFYTRYDRAYMVENGCGRLHAVVVMCAGRPSDEVESGSDSAKDGQESGR